MLAPLLLVVTSLGLDEHEGIKLRMARKKLAQFAEATQRARTSDATALSHVEAQGSFCNPGGDHLAASATQPLHLCEHARQPMRAMVGWKRMLRPASWGSISEVHHAA